MKYHIISDGSCDLGENAFEKYGVEIVPFYVAFDDKTYKKEIVEIGIREFYQEMVDHTDVFPKSSMPSVQDYIDVFEPHVKDNEAIICICITTKFSGSFNSAQNAKDILLETYPDAVITVIDAQINTVLQGIYVREAARMQRNGLGYEEVVQNLQRVRSTGRIIFTIGNMDYLIHGGRVGKVMGVAANKLGIRPMILLKDGEIFSNGIARSRKKSIEKVINQTREHFEKNHLDPNKYEIVVGFGYDYDEAVAFRDKLLESLKEYTNITEVGIYQIGATIGVHTGPYPIGVGLLERYDA